MVKTARYSRTHTLHREEVGLDRAQSCCDYRIFPFTPLCKWCTRDISVDFIECYFVQYILHRNSFYICLQSNARERVPEPRKTLGFLGSGEEEFRGQRRGLITQSLCVIVLLKYKRDRESFWHRHQKGQKECPLASVSNGVMYFLTTYYRESKECLEVVKTSLDPLP